GSDKRPVVDDGLLDRFLFAFPEPRPIRGEDWSEVSAEARDHWQTLIECLASLQPIQQPAPAAPAPGGLLQVLPRHGRKRTTELPAWHPRRLVLAPGARSSWEQFTRELAEQTMAEDFPECLHGPWSKFKGYAVRLALVLDALSWADQAGPADT